MQERAFLLGVFNANYSTPKWNQIWVFKTNSFYFTTLLKLLTIHPAFMVRQYGQQIHKIAY